MTTTPSDSTSTSTNASNNQNSEPRTWRNLGGLLPSKPEAANDGALYEFLPAAIEVEQTPSSKAGRAIIWLIVLLFLIAVLWASFGKIDIVAVAQGKVIPSGYTKQIQAIETAKIQTIHVRDGQQVKAGEPLVTLDSKQAAADVARLTNELNEARTALQRIRLFDQSIAARWSSAGLAIKPDPLADQRAVEAFEALPFKQQALLTQELLEYESQRESIANERASLLAERAMVDAEINKKQRVLPVLQERVDALNTLHQKSFGSKLQYLELKQEHIEEELDLAVQVARKQQLTASVKALITQEKALTAELRKQTLGQQNDYELKAASLEQELIKASERNRTFQLVAPITGQVQQLAVHTEGGVVTPAQVLMAIVPESTDLEVEAMILNKDIGFVEEGQAAQVKIDTFNFTKYGLIDAEIITISDDAIQDENLGLVYSTRIKLNKNSLLVEGREVTLSPGMSVTAEVKTGQRRLVEFFLSPLLRYKQESLSER